MGTEAFKLQKWEKSTIKNIIKRMEAEAGEDRARRDDFWPRGAGGKREPGGVVRMMVSCGAEGGRSRQVDRPRWRGSETGGGSRGSFYWAEPVTWGSEADPHMVLEMQRGWMEPEEAGLRNYLLEEAVRERDHRRVSAGQNQQEQEKQGNNLLKHIQ